jgi:hypothetical protein
MLRVDWESFGANVRAQAVGDAANYKQIEQRLGLSHARMINAAQGKPLGTEIFLTLCHWMQIDPMWFCQPQSPSSHNNENRGEGEHVLDASGYNCSCHARFSTRWEAAEHAAGILTGPPQP